MKMKSKYLFLISLALILVLTGCKMPFIVIETGQDEDQNDVLPQSQGEVSKQTDPTATPTLVVEDGPGTSSGTIGDLVWEDLNGNGRQDAAEPGDC